MIGTVIGLCIYFFTGVYFADRRNNGLLLVAWPVLVLFAAIRSVLRSPFRLAKWIKKRNTFPAPSNILAGMVATMLIKHPEGWDGDRWESGNISLDMSDKLSIVMVNKKPFEFHGDDEVKIKKAIKSSKEMKEAMIEAEKTAAREQKAIDHLSAIMGVGK